MELLNWRRGNFFVYFDMVTVLQKLLSAFYTIFLQDTTRTLYLGMIYDVGIIELTFCLFI